ncbi:MAG: hypothetical protein HYZ48_02035, partial [Chlamydiales bacterium]|nr:hypothetical protein [Chlamydiales bacterium]
IQKVKTVSKTIGIQDPNLFPQPEPHCNCTHCQVARALRLSIESSEPPVEEIVSDQDLQFRTWDIIQISEQLFTVQNPLDSKENYRVYLGDPVGCTCGEKHCEHIRTVLSS